MAKATTIETEPNALHTVTVSRAPPKIASDRKTRTIVSRLPTEVTIGPHTPRRICSIYHMTFEHDSLEDCGQEYYTMNPELKTAPLREMAAISRPVALSGGKTSGTTSRIWRMTRGIHKIRSV